METRLPSELEEFLHRHIQSVRQLEALLWLQARPGAFWTAEEVSKGIRASDGQVGGWLDTFAGAGLLARSGTGTLFRFEPADPLDAERAGRLAEEYKVRPRQVIEAIMRNAPAP